MCISTVIAGQTLALDVDMLIHEYAYDRVDTRREEKFFPWRVDSLSRFPRGGLPDVCAWHRAETGCRFRISKTSVSKASEPYLRSKGIFFHYVRF